MGISQSQVKQRCRWNWRPTGAKLYTHNALASIVSSSHGSPKARTYTGELVFSFDYIYI